MSRHAAQGCYCPRRGRRLKKTKTLPHASQVAAASPKIKRGEIKETLIAQQSGLEEAIIFTQLGFV